jgi:ring-1,2-phenylacetyl-CoA epoxidase subunit PaaA
VPDPDLRFDEATQHYQIGPIDWSEFQRVVKGHGPCNRERLEMRRRAHEEGRWVREAASVYASKELSRAAA